MRWTGSARDEGGVLGTFKTATECRENGFHVSFEQSRRIEPKTGKNFAVQDTLGIGGEFEILAFAKFPPDQTLFTNDPGEVLANGVATIGAFFLMKIVGCGRADDFNDQFRSAFD